MKKIEINYINKEELRDDTLKIVNYAIELMKQDSVDSVSLTEFYNYIKRAEDKLWKNKNRNYYIHNIPLESFSSDSQVIENILISKEKYVDENVIQNEKLHLCFKILRKCTETQRRRYLLHYYHGMTISEIAVHEDISNYAVICSLRSVDRKIKEYLKNQTY